MVSLYFSRAVFTLDSCYYSTLQVEPKTFLKAGLHFLQHYPHLVMEDSSAAPDRFCSIREESGCVGDETLQAHALKTCLEGIRGS